MPPVYIDDLNKRLGIFITLHGKHRDKAGFAIALQAKYPEETGLSLSSIQTWNSGGIPSKKVSLVANFMGITTDKFIGDYEDFEQAIKGALKETETRQANKTSLEDPNLKSYLNWLASQCNQLPSIGLMDSSQEGQTKLRLKDVYIDLTVQAFQGDKENVRNPELAPSEKQEPVSILTALKDHHKLVLLGDPGSGKTTFVNYLSYLLAKGDDNLEAHLQGKLPVRLILRELVATKSFKDATQGSSKLIWESLDNLLTKVFDESDAKAMLGSLKQANKQGGLVFFLDGLDEVGEGVRQKLLTSVQQLSALDGDHGNKYIVTARPYAYANPNWQLEDFPVFDLNHFSPTQISAFIHQWYERVGPQKGWHDDEKIEAEADQLIHALSLHPHLEDQAKRPLLLTLIASVHSSKGRLPDDRAELYEESLDLLLKRWQKQTLFDGNGQEETRLLGIDVDVLETHMDFIRQALENLAFETHQKQQGSGYANEADITEEALLKAFRRVIEKIPVKPLIAFLQDRAGILIPRDNQTYAFPHRSFQEYLAACYLLENEDDDDEINLIDLVISEPRWWKEVFLLAVGKLKQRSRPTARRLIQDLIPTEYGTGCADEAGSIYKVIVAAHGMKELGNSESKKISNKPTRQQKLNTCIQGWLTGLLTDLPIRDRVEAGAALGELGDPRPGVGIITKNERRLPDIDWVDIPAGNFEMGGDGKYDGKPIRKVTLKGFKLARYPVTNAQYALFIESGGYEYRLWWSEAGWQWKEGQLYSDKDSPDWIREDVKRSLPRYWENSKFNQPNQPVVGLSWYECEAYCQWLTDQLRAIGELSEDRCIKLPSEAQWEYGARGPEGRIYPWGHEWHKELCNNGELELGQTTTVGLFPRGRSPFGLEDMSGNAWEWVEDAWHKNYENAPEDGSAWLNNPTLINDKYEARVLRGGSWFLNPDDVRAASRNRIQPADRNNVIGLRLAQDSLSL